MGILTKEVEVRAGKDSPRYFNLGYDVPLKKREYRSGHNTLSNGMVFDKSKTFKVKFEDLPKYSKIPIEVQCDLCGKTYFVIKNNLLNYTSFKESGKIICEKCAKTKYFVKEKHGRWNPNKTDFDRENGRSYSEYNKLLYSVMIRDDFTCQICGATRDTIVHHMNSYSKFVEQRLDPTNCITLCSTCHKNFHLQYGYGNNTKEQFEQWSNKIFDELSDVNVTLPTTTEIYCYETDKFYESSKECAKELGLKNHKTILDCCNQRRNTTSYKGYHFILGHLAKEMTKDDIFDYLIKVTNTNGNSKFIDLNTGIIYFSASDCKKYTGFDKHYNLTDLKYKHENVVNGNYRFLPYEVFNKLSETEKNKLLKTTSIKLFNKIDKLEVI